MEIIQAQPLDFDDGYYTVRLFVNGDWTSRVSFGDIASKDIPIANGNNAAFDICGARSSSTQNLINTGSFDIMNLFMSPRAQVFHNNSAGNAIPFLQFFHFSSTSLDSTCQNRAFFASSQAACVQCSPGYRMIDNRKCVAFAPNSRYFLHIPTNSYQRIKIIKFM